MNTYYASEIADSTFFTENLYVDKKFLLLIPEVPFTNTLKKILEDWDFNLVYSEGEKTEHAEIDLTVLDADSSDADSSKEKKSEASSSATPTVLKLIETEYKKFYVFTEHVYQNYTAKQELNVRFVSDRVKELYDFVRDNKQLILRMRPQTKHQETNYLAIHSLQSTVYAIIIGLQLKMPSFKLIELAIACLLHEIGMTRLPPKIYLGNTPLTPQERKAMATHPIISYNILRERSFSLPICLGALEHHERENGSGYPRSLTLNKISLYGKIIAVACSYEAATAARPYKQAQDATSGLLELIRNEKKAYSDPILKALLFSLSFYPVGSYVHLSNGKIAQVIDVNPNDPRFPIVQIYRPPNSSEKPKMIGTSAAGIHILKPLTLSEQKKLT